MTGRDVVNSVLASMKTYPQRWLVGAALVLVFVVGAWVF